MVAERRLTGRILPRSFGLRLWSRNHQPLFIDPVDYALAQFALESPAERKARIYDWSEKHEESPEDAFEALKEGIIKTEKTENLLNHSRRTPTRKTDLALDHAKRYARNFKMNVKSRGDTKDHKGYHVVSLPLAGERDHPISYPSATCNCYDHRGGEDKGNLTQVCMHIAAGEIALAEDARSGLSRLENITGLSPQERQARFPSSLPFTFNAFRTPRTDAQKEVWRLVTDTLMAYYTKGASHYDLSAKILANENVFSPVLKGAILDNADVAEFKVLRQKEESRAVRSLSAEQDRRYAAERELVDKLSHYLKQKWGCEPRGYCREFVGTPWETVARRFEPARANRGRVYSIVLSDEHPPLVVARALGDKSPHWSESRDSVRKDHVAQKIGIGKYPARDDVTRRDGEAQLIVPDKPLQEAGYHLPQNLQDAYKALRAKL